MTVDERQAAWAALRMIRDAIGELFGPDASIESEEAVLLRGPEFHHEAEAIIAALQRVREKVGVLQHQGRREFWLWRRASEKSR